eukprot:6001261-Pleurochrysis_carterae.AAC.2
MRHSACVRFICAGGHYCAGDDTKCFSPRARFEHGAYKVDVCNLVTTAHRRIRVWFQCVSTILLRYPYHSISLRDHHMLRSCQQKKAYKGVVVKLSESCFDNKMSSHGSNVS